MNIDTRMVHHYMFSCAVMSCILYKVHDNLAVVWTTARLSLTATMLMVMVGGYFVNIPRPPPLTNWRLVEVAHLFNYTVTSTADTAYFDVGIYLNCRQISMDLVGPVCPGCVQSLSCHQSTSLMIS